MARSAQSTVAGPVADQLAERGRHRHPVVRTAEAGRPSFSHLERIGIDEISNREGQRCLTTVVDHATGHLVWAAAGQDRATVAKFFDEFGAEGCRRIWRVSRHAASLIVSGVDERCPKAIQSTDPYHVVSWATDDLDEVRRQVWNAARRDRGEPGLAQALKGARWALWHTPRTSPSASRRP